MIVHEFKLLMEGMCNCINIISTPKTGLEL